MKTEKSTILHKINQIFIDVLDNKDITLTESTSAKDIEEWDSLTNIQIIISIEKEFNIHFTTKDLLNLKSVKDIVECISTKLK